LDYIKGIRPAIYFNNQKSLHIIFKNNGRSSSHPTNNVNTLTEPQKVKSHPLAAYFLQPLTPKETNATIFMLA